MPSECKTSNNTIDKKKNEYCIPSAVYFTKDKKAIVGREALKQIQTDPQS